MLYPIVPALTFSGLPKTFHDGSVPKVADELVFDLIVTSLCVVCDTLLYIGTLTIIASDGETDGLMLGLIDGEILGLGLID